MKQKKKQENRPTHLWDSHRFANKSIKNRATLYSLCTVVTVSTNTLLDCGVDVVRDTTQPMSTPRATILVLTTHTITAHMKGVRVSRCLRPEDFIMYIHVYIYAYVYIFLCMYLCI